MLYHASASHGLVTKKEAVIESLEAYVRAGARVIITYFTPDLLEWLN